VTRVRDIVWLIAGLTIGVAITAPRSEGLRLEAGVGTCKAQKAQEGTWYQDDFEHHMQLHDRCGEFGIAYDTPLKDIKIAARYVNLGQYAVHAQANADDQDNAALRGSVSSNNRRPECAGGFAADCLYQWDGSGGVKGFLFAVGWEPVHLGPVHFGAEAGMYFYKARWRETIHPIDCPANQCWQMQIDQRTGWQRAPEFGLTARWEYLYTAVRRYELRMPGGTVNPMEATQAPGITTGFRAPIYQFVVGLSIPL
jgi:hypothetical protein